MVMTLVFNGMISFYYFTCYLLCDLHHSCSDSQFQVELFGHNLGVTIFICVSGLLLFLYMCLCLCYLIIMVRIMAMLKRGFIELYKQSKYKLIAALFVFMVCLSFRTYLFFSFYFRKEA